MTQYAYRDGQWDVWLTNGQRKVKISYPTHTRPDIKTVIPISWSYETLQKHLDTYRRKFASAYGGKWDLIILDAPPKPTGPLDRPVGACAKNEAIMLSDSYPDTPGKRFLQRLQASGDGSMLKAVTKALEIPKAVKTQKPRVDSLLTEEGPQGSNIPF